MVLKIYIKVRGTIGNFSLDTVIEKLLNLRLQKLNNYFFFYLSTDIIIVGTNSISIFRCNLILKNDTLINVRTTLKLLEIPTIL